MFLVVQFRKSIDIEKKPPAITNDYSGEINKHNLPDDGKSWRIIYLNAGYAAEKVYGLSDAFEHFDNDSTDYRHDFYSIRDILEGLFKRGAMSSDYDVEIKKEEELRSIAFKFWEHTTRVFSEDVVQKAVDHAVAEIEKQKVLSESEIKKLADEIFKIPGVEKYRILLPVDYLPH